MSDDVLEAFNTFRSNQTAPERTLFVVNWDAPEGIEALLRETVDPLPVALRRTDDPDRDRVERLGAIIETEFRVTAIGR